MGIYTHSDQLKVDALESVCSRIRLPLSMLTEEYSFFISFRVFHSLFHLLDTMT